MKQLKHSFIFLTNHLLVVCKFSMYIENTIINKITNFTKCVKPYCK